MSWPKVSELGSFDLERDLPTTAEDVSALRRLRRDQERSFVFDDWSVLQPIVGLPIDEDRRHATSAGWEPFEL